MNTVTIMGAQFTWGVKAEWAIARIENIPAGCKVIRRRFRPKAAGVAFVQDGDQMRKHYLELTHTGLRLGALVGINRKEPCH